MTPFVDIAFLILSFFIMATKMKPPAPVEITTPNSVSTEQLPENDALMVEIDKKGRVFFSMLADAKPEAKKSIIENINKTRGLGLTEAEMNNFVKFPSIGVPFTALKSLLSQPADKVNADIMPGIPVQDSATNELYYWVRDAVSAFAGSPVQYLIKGDNGAKYPVFKSVIQSFTRNEIFKFKLVTSPEDAPIGTALSRTRQSGAAPATSE
jgi:biopolymer transport protein ExbD